jgi:hypothetical protein
MHAIHPDPLRMLVAAAAALVLTIALLAMPPAIGELDLGLGGGTTAAEPVLAPASTTQPRWVSDPLTPPSLSIPTR